MLSKKLITIILAALLTLHITSVSFAQSVDELKQNINNHNEKIKQLDEEIKVYEKQLELAGDEAATLQSAIKTLDLNQKKISAEIRKTETNIQKTNLTISNLDNEITDTSAKVKSNSEAVVKSLNSIRQRDEESLIESLLSNKTLADVLDEYESLSQFQQSVREQSRELEMHKKDLSDKKTIKETEKQKLMSLKGEQSDQNQILGITKKEKNTLLTVTKNKEANYKKNLQEKIALKNAFEQELLEFESKLKFAIDPNSYSKAGKGILLWPLDKIKITQKFGDTDFARGGAYNGKGHNGVDFGASIGTPVKSAEAGVVVGTGNTDLVCSGASYGKWVLIEHQNGLSTLYAHLSLISVSQNQEVKRGGMIGYSGNTGYSTGPHLHFTVYATQGVRVMERKSLVCRGTYVMPVADLKAYLDPMSYL